MKKPRRKLWWLAIALALVIAGSLSGILPFDNASRSVLRPLASGLDQLGNSLGRRFQELGSLGGLSSQNQQLENQNNQLQQELSRLSELEKENAVLREQLGYSQRSQLKTIGAEVISYQPDAIRQFVRINRGGQDGIAVGNTVISGAALVGKVVSVTKHSADVMLVNDPDFRALVSTQSGQTSGIIKGQPGGALNMERIPRTQVIKIGETIVTNGLDSEFPKSLLVGQVESVGDSSESIFYVASVKPAVELGQLSLVQVVQGE